MIKRSKPKFKKREFFRINERIFSQTLRVLDEEGNQIDVLPKNKAIEIAKEKNLDLVEIAPKANPPVAKIIDFKKFLYQREKKKREEKRKTKTTETKEIRLGPFMDEHDLNVMIKRAQEFLNDSDKVRLVLQFKGRQITHPEFGEKKMDHVIESLSEISRVEREKHFEGKRLIALLAPLKKTSNA